MQCLRRRHPYVCLVLLPLILGAQAGTTTAPTTAPADGPFAGEIAAFEAADRRQMPPEGATLFIGSSSVRFWNTLAEDFPRIKVINRGFGGSQIADSTHYADRIIFPYRPGRIVFYAGDNDIAAEHKADQILADFTAFVAKVREGLPEVPIYYISIKPSPLRWRYAERIRQANAMIAESIKQDPKLHYVDVFTPMLGKDGTPRPELFRSDRLHMTRAGYELWTSILTPILTP